MSDFFKSSSNTTTSGSPTLWILVLCIGYPIIMCLLTVTILAIDLIVRRHDYINRNRQANATIQHAEETTNLLN
jgi:hypothetical protein